MPFQYACFISCQATADEQTRRSIEAFAQALGEALKPLRREPVYFNSERLAGRFDERTETAALYQSACFVVVSSGDYFDSERLDPAREYLALERLEQERLKALGEKPGPGAGFILVVFAQEGETTPAPLAGRLTLESPLLGPALAQLDTGKLPRVLPQFERLAQTIAGWCSRFDRAPHLFDNPDRFYLPDEKETRHWLQQVLSTPLVINQINIPPFEPAANIPPIPPAEQKAKRRRRTKAAEKEALPDLSELASEEDDLSGLVVGADELPIPIQQQMNLTPDTQTNVTPDTQTPDTQTNVTPDTETLDTEPLRPAELILSPSVETVLRAGAALLGISPRLAQKADLNLGPADGPPVSPTALLLAMDQLGRREQASQTLRFLAERLGRCPAELYERLYQAVFSFDPASAPDGLANLPPLELALERFDPAAVAAVREAEQIAHQTNGSREVHARHLLAALLLDRDGQLDGALGRLEVSLAGLRDGFLVFVERLPLDLNPEAWLDLFPATRRPGGLRPSFDADIFADHDYLDIKRHVEALAALIAARDIAPPLSIGLFGEWGSGKTFFMQQLMQAVAGKAHQAQAAPQLQKEIAFYKRVVQIEFNAWHYVEGNLWASLVEHIFTSLRQSKHAPQTEVEKAQEALLKELGVEQQAQQAADARVNQANEHLRQADQAVADARRRYEEQARALQRFTAQNILETVLSQEEAQGIINEARQKLGLPQVEVQAENFQAALGEVQAVLERGRSLLSTLLSTPDGRRRLTWLVVILVAGPLLGLVVGWLISLISSDLFAQLSAWLSSAAGVLGGGAEWLRRQGGWLSDRLKQLEEAEQGLEARLAEKQAQLQGQIVGKEKELELSKEEYVAAQQARNEAQQRVAQVQAELAQTTPSRLLADFIQQRVESSDYRKHLGVLALVRQDFKRLSDLIVEENRKLLQVQSLEEERQDEQYYINRIVLYIDDLDRCPPVNVVQVLQAVHLLLAFPLFVVVVAVDARWISRSLQVRYKELLGDGRPDLEALEASFWGGSATPLDYLEKIFQIPFWLSPMDSSGSRRMLRGLLKPNLAGPEVGAAGAGAEVDGGASAEGAGSPGTQSVPASLQRGPLEREGLGREGVAEEEGAAGSPGTQSVPASLQRGPLEREGLEREGLEREGAVEQEGVAEREERSGEEGPASLPRSGVGAPAGRSASTPEPADLNPAALTIWPAELAYMELLAPLLGRSPRSLKRFVNIYRLIKMSLSPVERRAFLLEGQTEGEFKLVMFLLALVTSSPALAAVFCRQVELLAHEPPDDDEGRSGVEALAGRDHAAGRRPAKASTPAHLISKSGPAAQADDLERLRLRLDREPTLQSDPDWRRVKAWLQPAKGHPPLQADIEQLLWWSRRVARYSFLLDPGLRPALSPLAEAA